MRPLSLFWKAFLFLLFPSVLCTLALYLYPALYRCDFPAPIHREASTPASNTNEQRDGAVQTKVAPFRLLVLADPQLEGDSSLPNPDDPTFPSLDRLRNRFLFSDIKTTPYPVWIAVGDFFSSDIPSLLQSYRKRLDLLGNDYFLAHIYRSLHWWLQPTHVTVLGDLLGSQWISDEEFDWRGWRYWNRVFKGGRKVEQEEILEEHDPAIPREVDKEWSRRIINVVGNHDVGYAGDVDRSRMDRFERVFGKANWDFNLHLPPRQRKIPGSDIKGAEESPELRVVILNSMNLDGPVRDPDIQHETYSFINDRLMQLARPVDDNMAATIILTHIPLHKQSGICVDSPMFNYSDTGVREQNHLSEFSSKNILEGILGHHGELNAPNHGIGRKSIILTGHDHEGCDVYHYIRPQTELGAAHSWEAARWDDASYLRHNSKIPGIREVTVRSMMGSFGGNAGMLSAWYDDDAGEWAFEYGTCPLGVQHLWWGVHVLDLVTMLMLVGVAASAVEEKIAHRRMIRRINARLRRPTVEFLLNKKSI